MPIPTSDVKNVSLESKEDQSGEVISSSSTEKKSKSDTDVEKRTEEKPSVFNGSKGPTTSKGGTSETSQTVPPSSSSASDKRTSNLGPASRSNTAGGPSTTGTSTKATSKSDSKRKEVEETNLTNLSTSECETSQSSKGRKSSRKGSKKKQNGGNGTGTLSEQQTNKEIVSAREELQLDSSDPNKEPETLPANNKGAHDRNSNKSCCFCWCCCCSCSCLSVKNQGKGKENNKQQQLSPLEHYFNGNGEAQPTLEEIRTWGESFDKLMKCPWGRKVFRDFLKCEYSEENILFWLACEDLKNETNPETIEEKARLIYEDYISILSPKEVSLDSQVREIINKNMVEPTASTFDEAQLQIYTLMHRDSYPRFINSPMYRKLAQLPSPTRKGSTA